MNGFVPSTRDTSHLNAAHDVARIARHDRRLFAAVANKTWEWTTRKPKAPTPLCAPRSTLFALLLPTAPMSIAPIPSDVSVAAGSHTIMHNRTPMKRTAHGRAELNALLVRRSLIRLGDRKAPVPDERRRSKREEGLRQGGVDGGPGVDIIERLARHQSAT